VPVHDWSKVAAGIFHDFHHEWISAIKRTLNHGLLPADFYALAEQIAGGLGPDVLTLEGPATNGAPLSSGSGSGGTVALAASPPQVWHRARTELDVYAARAKAVTIRHASDHRVVAIVEIVSPGNKSSRQSVRQFAEKSASLPSSTYGCRWRQHINQHGKPCPRSGRTFYRTSCLGIELRLVAVFDVQAAGVNLGRLRPSLDLKQDAAAEVHAAFHRSGSRGEHGSRGRPSLHVAPEF
jgi:Protein of unknown function (DUF4058)